MSADITGNEAIPFAKLRRREPRHQAWIEVSSDLLLAFFTEGQEFLPSVVIKGIPEGARLVEVGLRFGGTVQMLLEHPAFDAVPEGATPPVISDITFGKMDFDGSWRA